MSFMQGDPEAAFTGHLGRLAAVSPEGEVTRCLMDAHRHRPASRMGHGTAAAARRQADAADGMTATAPDRPSLRQRLFPNR